MVCHCLRDFQAIGVSARRTRRARQAREGAGGRSAKKKILSCGILSLLA